MSDQKETFSTWHESNYARIDWDPTGKIGQFVEFQTPKQSDWQAFLLDDVRYTPTAGNEPNWFHRLMHRWLLGIKWEKRDG